LPGVEQCRRNGYRTDINAEDVWIRRHGQSPEIISFVIIKGD
jgi:hypothetical protein